MVSWPGRLAREWPFLAAQFQSVGARRVLDVGTGTGMHAIWFAQHGIEAVGADPSTEMLAQAHDNAKGVKGVSFVQARLGAHAERVRGQFDAVTCLGNTLPHALTNEISNGHRRFRAVLRPGAASSSCSS